MPDALALFHALCSGTGRHLLGLPGFRQRQAVCPKSCILSRKLRISNCSPESQKKEKVSPPRLVLDELNLYVCLDAIFQTYSENTEAGCVFFHCRPSAAFVLRSASMMFLFPQPGRAGRLLCHRQLEAGQIYRNSSQRPVNLYLSDNSYLPANDKFPYIQILQSLSIRKTDIPGF